jgi:DNA-binding transcriptional LysR family regulator
MADSLCNSIISVSFGQFRRDYPNIRVNILTGSTADLLRMLDHNEVDMICTLDSHVYDKAYVIAGEEHLGVHFVVSPQNPLAEQAHIAPEQLPGLPFLLTEQNMSYRRLMDEQLSARSIQIHPVLEMGQTGILCRLVAEDIGVSLLPDFVTESARREGKVCFLNVDEIEVAVWRQVLYRREKWMSPHMKATISHLSKVKLM